MTHEERQALIRRPFPIVTVHVEDKKSHGGCLIPDPVDVRTPRDEYGVALRTALQRHLEEMD